MTTLDDDYKMIDPANVSPRPVAQKYGLIGSLVLIVVGLLTHLLGITDLSQQGGTGNWIANILNWGVMVGVIVLAIKTHRDSDLGGYISMGRGFKTGMIATLMMAIVMAVWSYVFFTLVAPEALEMIKEVALEEMESQGLSEEQMEASAGMMGFFTSPTFLVLVSLIGTLITGAIFSLIAGAIMKKETSQA